MVKENVLLSKMFQILGLKIGKNKYLSALEEMPKVNVLPVAKFVPKVLVAPVNSVHT